VKCEFQNMKYYVVRQFDATNKKQKRIIKNQKLYSQKKFIKV